jgi:hypothetical protein
MGVLCSKCSVRVRPIVVSDIDGTLSQYHVSVTTFCGDYFDKTMPVMPYIGDKPFREYLGITQQEHRAMKLAYRQGGFKRFIPAYPGASDLLNDLRMLGAEVWVATTRPWDRLDNIDPDTREWLRRNQIWVDGLLYGEDKYDQLLEAVDRTRIVACFEDLGEQMEIGGDLGLPMFQIYRDHNTYPGKRWPQGGNLRQAFTFARDAMAKWEYANEG